MKIAIVNLGRIVSGDWRDPFADGDTILTDGKVIIVDCPARRDFVSDTLDKAV